MKKNINKCKTLVKGTFLSGMLAITMGGFAQSSAVSADPQLGAISFINDIGFAVNANTLTEDDVVNLKVPVLNSNHGIAIPAGSCKIKIGLGSKLVLDPLYNINNAALSNYFRWTANTNSGQVELVGDLINPLPATVTDVNLAFKVKAGTEGVSVITANFLITNHNTNTVLSDENGANNAASIAYKVIMKGVQPANGEAENLTIYPNPAKDIKQVTVFANKGQFNGKYALNLYDAAGKLLQSSYVELSNVNKFAYNIGNLAAAKYLLKITKADIKPYLLKLEKF